ncbi:MAG: hypothetical protein ABJK37_11615 [Paraglaciecola sp.]|uniref:hypothetical protein n=1 Tax=Paraglaciecola sp. TaxID=1920173 RepID=UPI00329A53C3
MKRLGISIVVLWSFLAVTFYSVKISAQEQDPLNFMNQQLSAQLLNEVTALSDTKLVKAQAELLRKHYQALIESGFSKDEAMRLVIAMASQHKCQ